jgi:hypothetical protein
MAIVDVSDLYLVELVSLNYRWIGVQADTSEQALRLGTAGIGYEIHTQHGRILHRANVRHMRGEVTEDLRDTIVSASRSNKRGR